VVDAAVAVEAVEAAEVDAAAVVVAPAAA